MESVRERRIRHNVGKLGQAQIAEDFVGLSGLCHLFWVNERLPLEVVYILCYKNILIYMWKKTCSGARVEAT